MNMIADLKLFFGKDFVTLQLLQNRLCEIIVSVNEYSDKLFFLNNSIRSLDHLEFENRELHQVWTWATR